MLTKSTPRVHIKDADKGEVTAVFATLGVVDKDGDVILPGAIVSGSPVVISAYGHRSWNGALPVGKGTISEVGDELVLDGTFFMNTSGGLDTFTTVKECSDAGLQEWSFSLENVRWEAGEQDGRTVHFIKSVTVKECSPVLVGAGVNTRTLAVKTADLKFAEHIDAVLADVDELVARATEVVALRAPKGKQLASVSLEQLARLDRSIKQLAELLATEASTPTTVDLQAIRERVAFLALEGATT